MYTNSGRTAVIAGALILSITLVGCSSNSTDSAIGATKLLRNAVDCPPLPQPTVKADTPTIAILGTQGQTLTAYDQDANVIVHTATETKSRIIVNGVSDTSDAPNLLSNLVLQGEGNNNLERNTDINCKAAKVTESLNLLKQGKSPEHPNVFAALDALAENLSHNPSKQPIDVVLLTSLIARGGGIDLSSPKTLANPVTALNTLARKGLIPSCQNWRIYGVSPATGLSDVMAAQLKDFWIRYTQKCGGTLVAWEDHLATFPATSPITPADTSQIKVEQAKKEVTATLGADVLFAADSAALLDSATPALGELLALVNKYPGKIVITGHTNPTRSTTPERGTALSLLRATTVKEWLVNHNIDEHRISVIGKGASDPVYPNPTTDAERAANRRVVAVIDTEA